MERFMTVLNNRAKFLENKWVKLIIGFITLTNPIAMFPQFIQVISSPREEILGVSWPMFIVFATIQTAVLGSAIRNKDGYLFLSMFLSIIESLAIAIIVVERIYL